MLVLTGARLRCCIFALPAVYSPGSSVTYYVCLFELETMMACLDWCLKVMAEMKVMGNAVPLQKLFVMLQPVMFLFL